MNLNMMTMKNSISLILLTLAMIALFAVTLVLYPLPAETATDRNLQVEKEGVREELVDLRATINGQLEKIDRRLEDASEDAKEKLAAARETLEADREEIDSKLDEVEAATAETWNDVKAGTQETFPRVREKVQSASESIADLFESN